MNEKHAPSEYLMIEKWNQLMGAHAAHARTQQEVAANDGAPLNAIYKSIKGSRWVTTDEVMDAETRGFLGLPPLDPQKGKK